MSSVSSYRESDLYLAGAGMTEAEIDKYGDDVIELYGPYKERHEAAELKSRAESALSKMSVQDKMLAFSLANLSGLSIGL